ncbi:RDD family protein [Alkaliphilus transvaalensis]|uniref:RDD family protein n=1 Tax=Alkaliphilus transvaalensis TaxID=114628 RepID=UPI00054D6CEE|nr:RDD family protein [Alkaliphilus transvaalensis]
MKTTKILTPENVEVEYTLAGVGSRIAATIVDFAVQGLIIGVLLIATLLISQTSINFWEDYYGWLVGILILIYGILFYGYFIIMELTMNGQTLGKKVLKIRTIRRNGQPITLSHAAVRNLFKVLIDLFGIGVAMIFFSKENRRLGDLVASTIVVIEGKEVKPVSLINLTKIDPKLSYYLTQEEEELLKEYFERKNEIEDLQSFKSELKYHMISRFTELGILEEWKDFINEL